MDGASDPFHEGLAALGQPVAAEVGGLLRRRAGPSAADLAVELEPFEGRRAPYRVRASAHGRCWSLILKQVDPVVAQRNRRVARRWLPWLGLRDLAPALLGEATSPGGDAVWQIYEDLGGATLQQHRADRERVGAAVDRLAELHTRAGGHPLVAECRRHGQELGPHYFTSNVGDAARLLEALRPPRPEQARLRDRLRRRLEPLLADAPRRLRLLEEAGGPDTLLHGDPWTTNVLVLEAEDGFRVHLVDWDRTGAGPFAYDLSLLLYRFPARDRAWMVERYRDAVAPAGWRLPAAPELGLLFHTFECARYANRVVWAGTSLLCEEADWGWDELARIEEWFQGLEPALPDRGSTCGT